MATRNGNGQEKQARASYIRAPLVLLVLMTVLAGGIYPLLATAMAQLLFPTASKGSLIRQAERVVGSELLGQHFSDPKYFWGRPSATTPPYHASASAGSNLSPNHPALLEAVKARIAALKKHEHRNEQPIPVDLITASGSGLDPDISLEAAHYQAERVARARHKSVDDIRKLVAAHAQGDVFSGRRRVNVLKLNLALDQL